MIVAPLVEPAPAFEVVLNLSVTVEMVLPASGVRSNFKKLVCTGEVLTYKVVLTPPVVEAGCALSM